MLRVLLIIWVWLPSVCLDGMAMVLPANATIFLRQCQADLWFFRHHPRVTTYCSALNGDEIHHSESQFGNQLLRHLRRYMPQFLSICEWDRWLSSPYPPSPESRDSLYASQLNQTVHLPILSLTSRASFLNSSWWLVNDVLGFHCEVHRYSANSLIQNSARCIP